MPHPSTLGGQAEGTDPLKAETMKLTARERAQVDITKPAEVMGWCNKWGVTPERLRATVAEVGTSAVRVAAALGKPN